MARQDRYHPNYKKLYPDVELTDEVLNFLDKSDRKMEYAEVGLKVEGFTCDQKKMIARFLPSREDSFDRLLEDDVQFALDGLSPEDEAIHADELRRLRVCLGLLSDSESKLIHALYFEGLSERELAKRTKTHHMTIHSRKVKVLSKLKKLLKE